jgi:FAD/FMN-containing dehydrogenase
MSVSPWGRLPGMQREARSIWWRSDSPFVGGGVTLPFGQGRSYGDSCITPQGPVLRVAGLDRFIAFDGDAGRLRCESGVLLGDVLRHVVPRGWMLPVVPGTQFITVGGAVANDVHGKNHHRAGTFGRHVERLELVRSDGTRRVCSSDEHADLFAATIGGLGLTGVVTWVELRLAPIASFDVDVETLPFRSLDEFVAKTAAADAACDYTAAWFDFLSYRDGRVRGLLGLARPAPPDVESLRRGPRSARRAVPPLPFTLVHAASIRAFNALYYERNRRRAHARVPFDAYHFPLDALSHWNRLYGPRGFFQFQSVFPDGDGTAGLAEVLGLFAEAREGSFLATLKRFGEVPSPGWLSFPRAGITVTLDFPNRGSRTVDLIRRAHAIVLAHGGGLYPAKDACMTPRAFRASFPQWPRVEALRDPALSSAFWARVAAA